VELVLGGFKRIALGRLRVLLKTHCGRDFSLMLYVYVMVVYLDRVSFRARDWVLLFGRIREFLPVFEFQPNFKQP
jgi:hypothetical protein